jgi:hypothetical protein
MPENNPTTVGAFISDETGAFRRSLEVVTVTTVTGPRVVVVSRRARACFGLARLCGLLQPVRARMLTGALLDRCRLDPVNQALHLGAQRSTKC